MITYVRQDIKDCPFCGCRAMVKSYYRGGSDGASLMVYYVECTGCHVHQPIEKAATLREKAVDAWNRRV